MATIKSYTDLEQSKKLAEILSLESADNYYSWHDERYYIVNKDCPYPYSLKEKIPCWSLAALLGILAEQDFIIKSLERNNEYQYNIDIPSRHCKIWFSSLLDAAFEMVCWLKENNKL